MRLLKHNEDFTCKPSGCDLSSDSFPLIHSPATFESHLATTENDLMPRWEGVRKRQDCKRKPSQIFKTQKILAF